jgi:hypothetical protein
MTDNTISAVDGLFWALRIHLLGGMQIPIIESIDINTSMCFPETIGNTTWVVAEMLKTPSQYPTPTSR